MTEQTTVRLFAFAAFIACVIGANWALGEYGIIELPIVGVAAPAGVYFAGLTFGVRDILHEYGGRAWVVVAILAGALLSWLLEDAATIPGGVVTIAAASGLAFLFSEFVDFAIYTPLRNRNWPSAVAASNLVGSVVDSLLFLWLAFGTTANWWGNTLGKWLMIVPAIALMYVIRRAVPRYATN